MSRINVEELGNRLKFLSKCNVEIDVNMRNEHGVFVVKIKDTQDRMFGLQGNDLGLNLDRLVKYVEDSNK